MIRDISSDDIVAGNKKTNFRQIAEQWIARRGEELVEIRHREIRGEEFSDADLVRVDTEYATATTRERFLELTTAERRFPALFLWPKAIKVLQAIRTTPAPDDEEKTSGATRGRDSR